MSYLVHGQVLLSCLAKARHLYYFSSVGGAPVAQWVKSWPIDLADRVRSSLEVKSSQP